MPLVYKQEVFQPNQPQIAFGNLKLDDKSRTDSEIRPAFYSFVF